MSDPPTPAARAAARTTDDPWWDLHHAAYFGRLDVVKRLLDEGVDPNEPHPPAHTGWVCGPTALSKAITAWAVTRTHVEIVALLLERGARVANTHFTDWTIESCGAEVDVEIHDLLEKYAAKQGFVITR